MKVYIDQCHGCGQDRGAVSIANEEVESDKVSTLVAQKLRNLGYEVMIGRPTENWHTVKSSCNERAKRANDWGADLFISIHNNSGGGEGAEAYTYRGAKTEVAKRYLKFILNHGGKTHDGTLTHKTVDGAIKDGSDLIVINQSKMEAILFENFYVDNADDYNFFKNNVEMFSNAIVYAISGTDLTRKSTTIRKYRNLVIYANDVDKRAAEYLADYFSSLGEDGKALNVKDYKVGMGVSTWCVGGGLDNIKANAYLKGSNRFETLKAVCKKINLF